MTLSITDDDLETRSVTNEVEVSKINISPEVELKVEPATGPYKEGQPLVFNGCNSKDEDGTIIKYQFTIIRSTDNVLIRTTESSNCKIHHMFDPNDFGDYSRPGFKIILKIWDNWEATNERSIKIYVRKL